MGNSKPDFIKKYVVGHLDEFKVVATGLAVGVFKLDGYSDARVYYDTGLWGNIADQVAPIYGNKAGAEGSIDGFAHIKIDEKIGLFSSEEKGPEDARNLADLLVRMQEKHF